MSIFFKIFFAIVVLYNPIYLFSHSGGLNSEGCHRNGKTDINHCHSEEKKKGIKYNRKSYQYKSYKPNTDVGFYTNVKCETNIDHVVSLKDAHDSGAGFWSNTLKEKFANDKTNHVPACSRVNSSKGASTPFYFLRKSKDGKGMEYKIKSFCSYLEIYYQVKIKYTLSFKNNNADLFAICGLKYD